MSQQDLRYLNQVLTQLRRRWGELDKYLPEAKGRAKKLETLDYMDLLSLRMQALEVTRGEIKAGITEAGPPGNKDQEKLTGLLEKLSVEIDPEMRWTEVKGIAKKALDATREVQWNLDGRKLPR